MPTVAVKGCPTPEARPARTHLLKGFGPSPFLDGLFADRKQHGTAALVLGTHDMRTPLVTCVSTALTRHRLKELGLFAIFANYQMADVDDAVYAGVGAQALESGVVRLYGVVVILGGWVRCVRGRLSRVHWGPFPLAWRSRIALVGAGTSSLFVPLFYH
jgi:hypothetical protein